ncbi:hypothetical protein CONPUDRAFT_86144 [Coniophora puteana RWD-64-598 SS2]|uniref:Protein-S-isoprenylcysteine O-methyltransferase n=1 Tax=Coniophora puteana (strain RWD-64-598) TaxID=741705 RepID=A0A5M3N3K8_CONPW|nr:uncharacterized protein CONPUDRAFT_86144 [Coniophora puteana RWD-64-598 SS2]EIW85943.1 hypothetical protein CONPUDRAFT_86144 [Coniophora puteana RWD-64-598 SS2]
MYIAGFNVPFSPATDMDIPVFLSLSYVTYRNIKAAKSSMARASTEGGKIKPNTLPTTFVGKAVSPIHALAFFVPQLAYLVSVPLSGFKQPGWMLRCSLPSYDLTVNQQAGIRLLATGILLGIARFTMARLFSQLGSQLHGISRRENSKVVKHGFYSIVRHPMYSCVLVQEVLYGAMFWSYIPLAALPITAAAFAIKMPIEEGFILNDESTAEEYKAYKKDVPYRILPYIW